MSRLESVVQEIKTHIGDGVEPALKFIEQILSTGSDNYNDFIQIKGRYNSLQRELLLGTLDPNTYDKARSSISQALLILADTLQEDDLKPDTAPPLPSPDKRGEILYRIPERMQDHHEEKCTVRLAWVLEQLLRDWEKTAQDVVKDIRMAEIMGVYLLNVDEHNPFAIRTISEPVQFVDKDDYTEWIFYVKPLLVGEFPLVLRVSVIEMINGKEYKKDIVLEEQILVVSEEVPTPPEDFKKADKGLVLVGTDNKKSAAGAKPAAPEAAPEASSEAPVEAPLEGTGSATRNTGKWLGIALSTVALAIVGAFFGVPYLRDQTAWRNARQGGQRADYENYLAHFPDGWNRQAALDSLSRFGVLAPPQDTVHKEIVVPPAPVSDSLRSDTLRADSLPVKPVIVTPPPTKIPPKTPVKKPVKPVATPPKVKTQKPPPDKKPDTVVQKPVPPQSPSGPPTLTGHPAPFEMRPFSVIKTKSEEFQIKFLEFNEKGQALVTLASHSDWTLQEEQELVFVMADNQMVRAKLAYVGTSKQEERLYGYFLLDRSDLKKLADGRVSSLRLQDFKHPAIKGYPLTDGNRRELRQKAEKALKKMPN